ncbi:MAG: transcriptional regulator, partial [Acidobacteriota bacterium]
MDQEPRSQPPSTLHVGPWRVEPSLSRIYRGDGAREDPGDGRGTRIEPKAMELLLFLADRSPEVVSRSEIFDRVWGGRAVVDETLTRCVSLLRQALGDTAQAPRYIETIPRKGYRLIAEVRRSGTDAEPEPEPPGGRPPSARRRPSARSIGVVAAVLILAVGRRAPARGVRGGALEPRDPDGRGEDQDRRDDPDAPGGRPAAGGGGPAAGGFGLG